MTSLVPVSDVNRAAAIVRQNADALIEQLARRANGWDRGAYRDDDTLRFMSIRESIALHVSESFALSAQFRNVGSVRKIRTARGAYRVTRPADLCDAAAEIVRGLERELIRQDEEIADPRAPGADDFAVTVRGQVIRDLERYGCTVEIL